MVFFSHVQTLLGKFLKNEMIFFKKLLPALFAFVAMLVANSAIFVIPLFSHFHISDGNFI